MSLPHTNNAVRSHDKRKLYFSKFNEENRQWWFSMHQYYLNTVLPKKKVAAYFRRTVSVEFSNSTVEMHGYTAFLL
jgi:hypothetical protein